MNRSGQILSEFMITTLLLLIPLLWGGAWWFKLEWSRSKCAHETFFKARHQLIQTAKPVDYRLTCGTILERIQLSPLEDLDKDKGQLGVSDAIREASQLWEQASRSWRSLPEAASGESSSESKTIPDNKSPWIDAQEISSSNSELPP